MPKRFQPKEDDHSMDGILVVFVTALAISTGVLMYSLLRAEK